MNKDREPRKMLMMSKALHLRLKVEATRRELPLQEFGEELLRGALDDLAAMERWDLQDGQSK